jgi:hypothetical protein
MPDFMTIPALSDDGDPACQIAGDVGQNQVAITDWKCIPKNQIRLRVPRTGRTKTAIIAAAMSIQYYGAPNSSTIFRDSAPAPRPALSKPGLAGSTGFRRRSKSGPRFPNYRSLDAFAFNGNTNPGIAPNKNFGIIGSADMIIHF